MGSIIVNTKERVLCQGVSVFTGCQLCCKNILQQSRHLWLVLQKLLTVRGVDCRIRKEV